MTTRLILLLAALLLMVFAAAACGDDDDSDSPQTLEEYFGDLEGIFADFAETSDGIDSEHPDAFTELDDTQGYYSDLQTEMRSTFDDIAGLRPPAEIMAEHGDLVAATEAFYTEVTAINAEVGALEDNVALVEYVSGLRDDPDLTLATSNVADACHALQDIADANSISADLLCGEASDPTIGAILEQYFAAVKGIFDDADEATGEAEATLNEATTGATFDEQKTAIDAYLTDIEAIFTDTINRLRALGAPVDVDGAQRDFVDAVEDMLASSSAFQENLPNIADAEQLDTRRADFGEEIAAAVGRADAACVELQQVADSRGIEVDLGCEG